MIPIDLGKQEALDADQKAIQQINFTRNLHRAAGATRSKRNPFKFFTSNCKSIYLFVFLFICLVLFFCFNIKWHNTLIVKLSTSQINKLKSGIKNDIDITLKIPSNIIPDSNNENNFPHKFILTNAQVSKLHKAFANNSSANIKLSKTHLHKLRQSGGFSSRVLGLLLKIGLSWYYENT